MALTTARVLRTIRTLVDKFEESSSPLSVCSLAGSVSTILCVIIPLLVIGGLCLVTGQSLVHLTSPPDIRYQWEEIPLANTTSGSTTTWEPCISSVIDIPVHGPNIFEVAHSFGLSRRVRIVAYTTSFVRSLEYAVYPSEGSKAMGSGSLSNTRGVTQYEILKMKQPWVPPSISCVSDVNTSCQCLGQDVQAYSAGRSALIVGELGQHESMIRVEISGQMDSTESGNAAQLFLAAYSETILGFGIIAFGNFLSIFGAAFLAISLCLSCPAACFFVYGSHPATAGVVISAARGDAARMYEMIVNGMEEERSDEDLDS